MVNHVGFGLHTDNLFPIKGSFSRCCCRSHQGEARHSPTNDTLVRALQVTSCTGVVASVKKDVYFHLKHKLDESYRLRCLMIVASTSQCFMLRMGHPTWHSHEHHFWNL